jgi:serine/threonine protein kinase
MAKLKHNNLVALRGISMKDPPAIALEYVEFGALHVLLAENHGLDLNLKVRFAFDIGVCFVSRLFCVGFVSICLFVLVSFRFVFLLLFRFVLAGFLFLFVVAFRSRFISHLAALGLSFMHGMQPPLVHCDLKSPNILIASLDFMSDCCAKICDFGTCKPLFTEKLRGRKSKDRDVMNPTWLPPEVIEGKAFDCSADIYSFGTLSVFSFSLGF